MGKRWARGLGDRWTTWAGLLACVVLAAAGCDIAKQSPTSLTGPSELGLSLTLSADPSVITQDGSSWTRVTVLARGASAQPLANVAMRAEIQVSGTLADFGQLSTRTVVTGSDGRGSVIYTAPPPPRESVDTFTIVTLLFTPLEPNFANALPRSLEVRLVPPGVLLPPNGAPTASFTVSSPTEQGNPISFDATGSSDADGTIVAYAWDFGDGTAGSGATAQHTYSRGGTFTVILTVTDDRGQSATATQQVVVTASANPTASFAVSPTSPAVGEQVSFNASASRAGTGRQIVDYAWDFGDGGSASGAVATHTYAAPGTYTVVLAVTDDLGNSGTTTNTVLVGNPLRPTASFVISPTSPNIGQSVFFDASASTAPAGRTIASHQWAFGDGATASGQTASHRYASPGTFVVVLTVTDSAGQTDVSTKNVAVTGSASAKFTVSPSPAPLAGGSVTVTVNAAQSTPSAGGQVTTYQWNFGDGTLLETVTSSTHSHVYTVAGVYTISLTITDNVGQTAATTQTITVQ